MGEYGFSQVDVFASTALSGNPVAVVHAADTLTDEQMQRLALWTNLSETAFLLEPTDPRADYRVRIFTPSRELPFAGHPTLGAAHAWSGGADGGGELLQECAAGLVSVRRRDDGLLAFAAPDPVREGPVEETLLAQVRSVFEMTAADVVDAQWVDNGPEWMAVLLPDAASVLRARPGPSPLAATTRIGLVGAHAPGGDAALEVRAFHPGPVGFGEDPATGSLNAGIARWLIATGRMPASYVAAQGTAVGRRSRLFVDTHDGRIWVGGATTTVVAGTVALPTDRVRA